MDFLIDKPAADNQINSGKSLAFLCHGNRISMDYRPAKYYSKMDFCESSPFGISS